MPTPNGGPAWLAIVQALAAEIIAGLHRILGFSYSDNEEHYIYQVSLQPTAANGIGAQLQQGVAIGQDSDFICTRVTTVSRANGTGVVIAPSAAAGGAAEGIGDAPFLLLIKHGGSDRQLANTAVDAWGAYGSSGGLPGIWAKPRLFERSSRIQCEVTLLKNIGAIWDIRILFHGWKIYDASSLDLTRTRA